MTASDDLAPRQPAENDLAKDKIRDEIDCIDESVARITDAEVNENLRKVISRAGYAVPAAARRSANHMDDPLVSMTVGVHRTTDTATHRDEILNAPPRPAGQHAGLAALDLAAAAGEELPSLLAMLDIITELISPDDPAYIERPSNNAELIIRTEGSSMPWCRRAPG